MVTVSRFEHRALGLRTRRTAFLRFRTLCVGATFAVCLERYSIHRSIRSGRRRPTPGGTMAQQSSPRVVVVTGASGGIGRASARAFAARGDTIALLARGSSGLEAAASDVRARGAIALPITVDVSDAAAIEAAAARVEEELGPIDVWV